MARDRYEYARHVMVQKHIEAKGVRDPRILDILRQVPRHLFVPQRVRAEAYSEHALSIDEGQTISAPYTVARMTEILDVHEDHSVLEIGTGSAYQTVILAYLARVVYSLERIPALARRAISRVRLFELDNVKIQAFDGTWGWSEWAPYDRILVTAGSPTVPQPLLDQLKAGGRLVLPEGDRQRQHLVVYDNLGNRIERQEVEEASFVPLIGRHGWDEEERA